MPVPPRFTGHLRNVTERRKAEAPDSTEQFTHITRTLEENLLPPGLSAVDRVEPACAYRPAGEGDQPGGDSYDVFETARPDWAVVAGEAIGNDTWAAALTALVPYTVWAAATRTCPPTSAPRPLNEALYRQRPEQFCTIACGGLRAPGLRAPACPSASARPQGATIPRS